MSTLGGGGNDSNIVDAVGRETWTCGGHKGQLLLQSDDSPLVYSRDLLFPPYDRENVQGTQK